MAGSRAIESVMTRSSFLVKHGKMSGMPRRARVMTWNGKDVPPELRELPAGRYVVEAAEDEALVVSQVDLARIEEVRRNWPFLRDRRTDAYDGIQHRFLTD